MILSNDHHHHIRLTITITIVQSVPQCPRHTHTSISQVFIVTYIGHKMLQIFYWLAIKPSQTYDHHQRCDQKEMNEYFVGNLPTKTDDYIKGIHTHTHTK